MESKKIFIILFVISILAFIFSLSINVFHPPSLEKPINKAISSIYPETAPKDRIKESQIHVYEDKVVIDIKNPKWAKFADTGSMKPYFDQGSNAIQIQPSFPEDIQIGDIISYEHQGNIIIHRVIEIGKDDKGIYYQVKGDNNLSKDPLKVRFSQVRRILVGIIY